MSPIFLFSFYIYTDLILKFQLRLGNVRYLILEDTEDMMGTEHIDAMVHIVRDSGMPKKGHRLKCQTLMFTERMSDDYMRCVVESMYILDCLLITMGGGPV